MKVEWESNGNGYHKLILDGRWLGTLGNRSAYVWCGERSVYSTEIGPLPEEVLAMPLEQRKLWLLTLTRLEIAQKGRTRA